MKSLRRILIAAGILTSLACSDSSSPEVLCPTPGVDIAVGAEVVFSWGDCALRSLSVVDPFGRTIWSIEGTFGSPVTYGVTPSGASHSSPAEALEVGRSYTVATASDGVPVFDTFVR